MPAMTSLMSSFTSVNLMEDSIPPDVAQQARQAGTRLAEREVNEQRLPLDVLLRHEPPVAAALRVVAVVAHHEVMPVGNAHRTVAAGDIEVREIRCARRAILGREDEVHVRLVERHAVDVDLLVPQLD